MRLVVIGGVAAGLSAAARARRLDPSMEITVVEKGDWVSYGACGLPYYVEGRLQRPEQLVVYTPDYFRRQRNIDVRTRTEAVAISHARREVRLNSGESLRYDRLIIATGARQDRRGIEGAGQPRVFSINTMEEAIRLRACLDAAPGSLRAVVIGAGYIGLEAAEALRARGCAVTVFGSGAHVLGRRDARLTEQVGRHLGQFRVQLRLNERVTAIEADRVNGVPCDLVVLATGLLPNAELASDAGVQLGRTGAIPTTEQMQTNLAGVYAAGDCAEAMHRVLGRPEFVPLGTTANKMGRVAGAAAAGARERFPGIVGTAIVRICGLAVATTGVSASQARHHGFDPASAFIEAREKAPYFRGRKGTVELVADRRSGRLLGATVSGEDGVAGRINVVATALYNRMTAEDFLHLDLAYAPPYATVWDPLLLAAQQLEKLLH